MDILVIGGGISGLATAFAIERLAEQRGIEVVVRVIEATERLGGKVDTRRVGDFTVEAGVNGWLDSKPTTEELCATLGLDERKLISRDAARTRFIFRHGTLHRVPEGPGRLLTSPLLSWRGKLRLLREPWAKPATPGESDETLAAFARRRLGPEALEALIDPLVGGVFAGDPERMSLASSFPSLAALEADHGSLLRGLLKRRRPRKNGGPPPATRAAARGGRLISLAGGTQDLVGALAERLGIAPQTGTPVQSLQRQGGGFVATLRDGRKLTAERVILATPAWAAAPILEPLHPELARTVAEIPYAPLAVVALGWRQEAFAAPPESFGFVIPHSEQRPSLGTLFESCVFALRAPPGQVLTRTMVGGMRRAALAARDDDALVALVQDELRSIAGVHEKPLMTAVIKHPHAIPQYAPGHRQRLTRIDGLTSACRGLTITGNAYHGVGLNDCTARAKVVAAAILSK